MLTIKKLYNFLDALFFSLWGVTLVDVLPFFDKTFFDTLDGKLKTVFIFFGLIFFIMKIIFFVLEKIIDWKIKKIDRESKEFDLDTKKKNSNTFKM